MPPASLRSLREKARYPLPSFRGIHGEVIDPSPHAVVSSENCPDGLIVFMCDPEEIRLDGSFSSDQFGWFIPGRILWKDNAPQRHHRVVVRVLVCPNKKPPWIHVGILVHRGERGTCPGYRLQVH